MSATTDGLPEGAAVEFCASCGESVDVCDICGDCMNCTCLCEDEDYDYCQ